MFEKLLSSLPFNPGIVQQISFYYQRIRAEQNVRRIGLIFLVFAFLIQFFAFISPPVPTLAASPNDLINGGFSSAAEAASYCRSNLEQYGTILGYYGITCNQVANANTITINSDDWNHQLWSMGRLPYNITGETPVSIPGLNYSLYERYLWGWDKPGTSSNYQVLNVTSTGGQTFLLMYACGNLVSVGFPQPVKHPPNITLSKTTIPGFPAANSNIAPGTTLGFRIYFNNLGGAASNVYVTDPEPANTSEVWMGSGGATLYNYKGNSANWYYANFPSGATNYYVDVEYKVNSNTPNGTNICNTASIISAQTPTQNSNKICFTVKTKSPPPPITPPVKKTQPPCELQLSSQNAGACVTISKSATNITDNILNANGTTAAAGNIIKYTLSAKNIGSNTVKNYQFSDNLSYVLDYSKITSTGGGIIGSNNQITWPVTNISPNQTVTESFQVKIDNPIPQTPSSTSDPNYFNNKMTNTFGNTITISLPPTTTQVIQSTSSALPNTGPGTSIIIGAVVVAIAGFFFYRSRLLAKEAKLAVMDSGGM